MAQLEDEFGDIIAKARIGSGLSAAQLAGRLGLSEREIQEIESYRLTPGPDAVRGLAASLGLDSDKLAVSAVCGWVPSQLDTSRQRFVLEAIHAPYGENAYVLGCPGTRLAVVVDPGGALEEIIRALADQDLRLRYVLVTHAHGDHIGGLRTLVEAMRGVTVISSRIDRDAVMVGVDAEWETAEDGGSIALGGLKIATVSTPGHTPGSMCYKIPGACFVGDTLFAGSIGRPAGASVYRGMLDAIKSKVLNLPNETALLPGHGPPTTVGAEKLHNPFF